MYTPTTADIELIQELAKSLPPVRRSVRRKLTGAQLQDIGYSSWKNASIDPAATYELEVVHEANLVKVITDIVTQEGMDEVAAIVEQLRTGRPMLTVMGTIMFSRTAA